MNWSQKGIIRWSASGVTAFALVTVLVSGRVHAQTFQKLFDFDSPARHPVAALCKGSDGNFYGSTRGDWSSREGNAIFKMSPQGEVTVLHRFPTRTGVILGPFTEANDGNFYAVKQSHPGNAGIVRVSNSGLLETIAEFTGTNGAVPALARLVKGGDDALYGVTHNGGTANQGTIFRVTTSGELTAVHSFSESGPAGYHPQTLIAGEEGIFYGTALLGGASGKGTIFQFTPQGVVTVVTSFPSGATASPSDILIQGDNGFFFGVPSASLKRHLIYKVSTAEANPTVINLTNAVESLAKGTDGNLYAILSGATTRVLKVSQSGQISPVATTTAPMTGISGLVQDGAAFFGVASDGGTSRIGALFKIDTVVQSISTLYSFTWTDEGGQPSGRLVRTPDGSLYGTLARGGPEDRGAVFRVVNCIVTNIYPFTNSMVNMPVAGLTLGNDGNLYGVSSNGGTHGLGSIFRMTPSGVVSDIGSFTNAIAGRYPEKELVLSSTGELYGTTRSGGQDDAGTIFKVTTAGTLTFVAGLVGRLQAREPAGPLVEHTDGSFIGVTQRPFLGAGWGWPGTLFKVTTNGEVSTLFNFDGTNGSSPRSGLIRATNGNYYGTTTFGGTNQWGTIFRYNPEQGLTTLQSFSVSNGMPYGLMQASDGFIYGLTSPTNAPATIFRMNLQGELVTWHTFSADDGVRSVGALCEGADGWLYGLGAIGGTRGGGTLFRVNPRAAFIEPGSVSLTNGQLRFLLHGGPGATVVVQRSSDLVIWSAVATNIPPEGTLGFVDSQPVGAVKAFYRLREVGD